MTFAYLGILVIFLSSLLYGTEKNGYLELENLKRITQLSLIMVLVFFNYREVNYLQLQSHLKKVIVLFYVYVVFFFVLMLSKPGLYEVIIAFIYPESESMISENIRNLKYSFHFTDPNSFGYLLVLCFVLICFVNFTRKVIVTLFTATLVLVIATQSRGALLALLAVVSIYWALFFDYKVKLYSVVFITLLLVLLFTVSSDYIEFYWGLYEKRRHIEEEMGKGVGGGRLDAWYYFAQNINVNPFFGIGYHLEREGALFRPHSDFIRLQLSYGTLIFFCFFLLFNRFGKRHLMLWAAFSVPFMINTIIDDYRLFGLFLVLFFILKWNSRIAPAIRYSPVKTPRSEFHSLH
jgi:hypothetical protein